MTSLAARHERAVVAAVFHESDGGAMIAQCVIGAAVHWRIESI